MQQVNATGLILFSFTYLILSGLLLGTTQMGTATAITASEILFTLAVASITAVVIALAIGAIGAVASSFRLFGSGFDAPEVIWKAALWGALLGFVLVWAAYLGGRLIAICPPGTPSFISVLMIGPPLGAMLWGMMAALFSLRE